MAQRFTIQVNGAKHSVHATTDTPLLFVLRNELRLHGPRFGCGLAQCGACTVMLGNQAIRSCVTPVGAVTGKKLTTLEGLGTAAKPHPLQTAFIEHQVPQCGYCTNGMIMSAAGLLAQQQKPSEDDVRAALEINLCRCGTHARVVSAVMAASGQRG
jgi:nicotinate dehydrogenase subunit A